LHRNHLRNSTLRRSGSYESTPQRRHLEAPSGGTVSGNNMQRKNALMKIPKSDAVNFAKSVRLNQQRLASELKSHYDFIVCGAGTSGCVVAARLASDPKIQVLLLEAGGTDETDLITNPNRWPLTLGSELDWGFVAEPNPNLNGRAIRYSMGKVLGGGSSINVSTWSHGHRA